LRGAIEGAYETGKSSARTKLEYGLSPYKLACMLLKKVRYCTAGIPEMVPLVLVSTKVTLITGFVPVSRPLM
jgi:hypothetical protein